MNLFSPLLADRRAYPFWILALSAVHMLAGLLAWLVWMQTGDSHSVDLYFQLPGPLYLVLAAILQTWFAYRSWRNFTMEQPMWTAWACLTLAGLSRLAGDFIAQVLTAFTPLNPLPQYAANANLHEIGLTFAGPVHLLFLLLACRVAIQVYRSVGWRAKIRPLDYLFVAPIAAHVLQQGWDLFVLYPGEFSLPMRIALWLTDPLLLILSILALILWRTVREHSGGLVGMCWGFYAAGVFLTVIGDIALWAVEAGVVHWIPASFISSYVWFPAATAFVLAPACQVEALRGLSRRPQAALGGSNLLNPETP
ncbi:MAG: hypothetical protein HY858_09535 [Candidatus Solibacter usitatus]|nr:hypothetical protein [Candidatus Solibacter usitatus]